MLEVHAIDLRDNGKGLIGLDIDISLKTKRYKISQEQLDEANVINEEHLPLFREKGTVTINNDGTTTIKNVVGAALPRGGTGLALGNPEEPEPQTLFASIPLTVENIDIESDIELSINSFPAAGGVRANRENLMILNDTNREKVWMLNINGTQEEVGNHAFILQKREDEKTFEKHIIVSVNNTNDSPRIKEEYNEDIEIIQNAKRGYYLGMI